MLRFKLFSILTVLTVSTAFAQTEKLRYGDFNNWVTRTIHESAVIGGHDKTLYEVGPTQSIDGNIAYTPKGGSPWGTSNVYAKVSGVVKGSCAVVPANDPGFGKCAKLESKLEEVKVLGLINMKVMVAGSLFLGKMIEPISSTSNPYSKMDMGMPFTKRPKYLVYDYKVDVPAGVNYRIKSTGFGSKKQLPGRDECVVFVLLQRRWEDAGGNLHAKRVGTAGQLYKNASAWKRSNKLPIVYGDPTGKPGYGSYLGLRKDNAYYAYNSKGKLKPVIEEGWDSPDATPTHVVLMFSAGNGEPYVGTPGLTFYVDNVAFAY